MPKQLIIFINLPGVINPKVSVFMSHAIQRSQRLSSECSALHIVTDDKGLLSVLDVRNSPVQLYHGVPSLNTPQNKNHKLNLHNEKMFANLITKLIPIEGTYEHILVIGEMQQYQYQKHTTHTISSIQNIEGLAQLLLSINMQYARHKATLRVQICSSGSFRLAHGDRTFAERITPISKMVQLSAPMDWSIVGKNGLAIDFVASYSEFKHLTPIIYQAVCSAWSKNKIESNFQDMLLESNTPHINALKIMRVQTLERFQIDCIYPIKDRPLSLFASREISPVSPDFNARYDSSSPIPENFGSMSP